MRKPRHLSPEDRAIWDQVARRIAPMHPRRKEPEPEKPVRKPAPKPSIPAFEVGVKASFSRKDDLLPGLGQVLRQAPVQMDHKAFGKMTRGKLKPEARIDLHGMTMDQAHPELLAFILGSQEIGRRLVLVITGKGKARDDGGPMPVRQGVLRHHVPQSLRLPPLGQAVLEVRPAHLRHGGEGAYYVYLRKRR